jgi:hypothetical protein
MPTPETPSFLLAASVRDQLGVVLLLSPQQRGPEYAAMTARIENALAAECASYVRSAARGRAGSSRMMAEKFESSGIREGIEFSNESYNVPDLVIGEKIAPGGHGGVSDPMLYDPEHFIVVI